MKTFNRRLWLNKSNISSTGSIVCYSGKSPWTDKNTSKPVTIRFVEVADCHNKIRIHQSERESLADFVKKVERMKNMLNEYQIFLETELLS